MDGRFQGAVPDRERRVLPSADNCDQHARFLLECHGLLSTETATAPPVVERVFREYGPPLAIRTDNGVPFATLAVHGLSYLNVWWMRLGIVHQRIHPIAGT